jgi:uncharacterized membrane protein YdbT with pleckstrin-like domain
MINLEKGETILLKVRKHWIVLLTEAAFLIVVLTLPLIVYGVLQFANIQSSIDIGGSMNALFVFLASLWLLYVWVAFFIIWTDYYLDVLIVTDKHIIDIEQRGLFNRELSTFRLDRVQDVTVEMRGIIQTVFNYGTVHVQTAGENREFTMVGVPNPFDIKSFISKHHDTAIEKLRTVHLSDAALKRLNDI